MAEKKKNVSSGAEKAEKLALANKTTATDKKSKTVKSDKTKTTAKRAPKKTVGAKKSGAKTKKGASAVKSAKRAERKAKREERRLAKAKLNAEKKQARLERKLAHKERKADRVAAMKEKRAERKARKQELYEQRKERRAILKSESKEARAKRIASEKQAKREAQKAKHEAYLAEKQAKREHALKIRAEKRAARFEKKRSPGFGGWLAAVISLGVTTLALGTIVTFGAITMNDMQVSMASNYTESLYELNSVIDNIDANLTRARVSSSSSDRVRVFSDLATQSEAAEIILERFPLDMQMTEQLASFVNKMSDSTKQMLYTVANGGELTASQKKSLEYMYSTNKKVKEELNNLVSTCDGKDMMNAMRGKDSLLGIGFTTIQNNTFEDPKGIQDGPFSDSLNKTNAKALKGAEEITAPAAEKLATKYFADYKVSGANCTGEAVANQITVYNVNLTTPDGEMLVQISKLGGKVVAFDSYKDCTKHNFSVDRCKAIAEDFLADIGYTDLTAVWVSENGTTCNLNYAPVKGGAILYPDLIKVKVCEERGIVTGVEAISYVLNHGERTVAKASVSEKAAQSNINGNIEVKSSRLALIPFEGAEVLCYEFCGSMDGNDYYVYVDATTGEEVEVLTVIGTAQGRALM